jgi:GMP synthase (glutamine-hydrolysing)
VAWQSHNDEIKKLPECFVSLARSENCAHEAIKHKTKPFYGLQFHPEVEQTEHGYEIFKNFIRICEDHAKTGKHILF